MDLFFSMWLALMAMMTSTSSGNALSMRNLESAQSRSDAGGVVVVKSLPPTQVELAAKLPDTLADMLCLQLDVLVVVKACAHGCPLVVPSVWKATV